MESCKLPEPSRSCCESTIGEWHREGCPNATVVTMRQCCGTQIHVDHVGKCPDGEDCKVCKNHAPNCIVMVQLAASFAKDEERWTERYVTNSSENMRKRVVAAQNGRYEVRDATDWISDA